MMCLKQSTQSVREQTDANCVERISFLVAMAEGVASATPLPPTPTLFHIHLNPPKAIAT